MGRRLHPIAEREGRGRGSPEGLPAVSGGARASSWLRRSRASAGWSWRGRRRPEMAAIERWPWWREELGIARARARAHAVRCGRGRGGEGSGVVLCRGQGEAFIAAGRQWRELGVWCARQRRSGHASVRVGCVRRWQGLGRHRRGDSGSRASWRAAWWSGPARAGSGLVGVAEARGACQVLDSVSAGSAPAIAGSSGGQNWRGRAG